MPKKNKVKQTQKKLEPPQPQPQPEIESLSQSSSEDEDAALLTPKVEETLLSTLAKIKMKHPSIYKTKESLYQQEYFENEEKETQKQAKNVKQKFTYQDLVKQSDSENESNDNLPPVLEQKKAKQKFKKTLSKNIEKVTNDEDDLFKIKTKVVSEKEGQKPQTEKQKLKELTKNYDKESKKLIKSLWKSEQLDDTDLFLKNYILDKKWLSSKLKPSEMIQQKVDEEDQQRSQQMDKYQAQYNFRFQEPGGNFINQYPRNMENSLRQKTQTRREKRKKREEKKKEEEQQRKKQTLKRKQQLKQSILDKIVPEEQEQQEHDWFFCDDCCKGLTQGERIWQCNQCEDFMLCDECNELIIHKHKLSKGVVPKGFGAPEAGQDRVKSLEPCIVCRRRITPNQKSYQYTDRNYIVNALCETCYDNSGLDIKKKYRLVEPQAVNYEQILQRDPQKIKQLTNLKQIEEMVDQYMENDYEDVISGGLKTKFKYIQVKPESYGLSDEQILFGDDKELNNYISVKKLAPYREDLMKLRNNIFKKKIKGIKRSVKQNQNILNKAPNKIAKLKQTAKRKNRVQAVHKRMQKKLRVVNISKKDAERDHFVPQSRLISYGIVNQEGQK